MRIAYPYTYTEDIIPPRCRKMRPVAFNGVLHCTIPEITAEEAPVAIVRQKCSIYSELRWRWYKCKLWLDRGAFRADTRDGPYPAFDPSQWPFAPNASWWNGQEAAVKGLRRHFRQFVIIDDQPHRSAFEPVYKVMTFGLGHNHGGTALMSELCGYNPNIPWDRYFPLSQREAAIAEATRIAAARGDTDDLPIRPHNDFDILIPEAIRAKPKRDYGGKGDAFINRVERMIEKSDSTIEAGLGALLILSKDLSPATTNSTF